MYYFNMAIQPLKTPTHKLYRALHNKLYIGLILQYNQRYNKTNWLDNIKYTKSAHNTYTSKIINIK